MTKLTAETGFVLSSASDFKIGKKINTVETQKNIKVLTNHDRILEEIEHLYFFIPSPNLDNFKNVFEFCKNFLFFSESQKNSFQDRYNLLLGEECLMCAIFEMSKSKKTIKEKKEWLINFASNLNYEIFCYDHHLSCNSNLELNTVINRHDTCKLLNDFRKYKSTVFKQNLTIVDRNIIIYKRKNKSEFDCIYKSKSKTKQCKSNEYADLVRNECDSDSVENETYFVIHFFSVLITFCQINFETSVELCIRFSNINYRNNIQSCAFNNFSGITTRNQIQFLEDSGFKSSLNKDNKDGAILINDAQQTNIGLSWENGLEENNLNTVDIENYEIAVWKRVKIKQPLEMKAVCINLNDYAQHLYIQIKNVTEDNISILIEDIHVCQNSLNFKNNFPIRLNPSEEYAFFFCFDVFNFLNNFLSSEFSNVDSSTLMCSNLDFAKSDSTSFSLALRSCNSPLCLDFTSNELEKKKKCKKRIKEEEREKKKKKKSLIQENTAKRIISVPIYLKWSIVGVLSTSNFAHFSSDCHIPCAFPLNITFTFLGVKMNTNEFCLLIRVKNIGMHDKVDLIAYFTKDITKTNLKNFSFENFEFLSLIPLRTKIEFGKIAEGEIVSSYAHFIAMRCGLHTVPPLLFIDRLNNKKFFARGVHVYVNFDEQL